LIRCTELKLPALGVVGTYVLSQKFHSLHSREVQEQQRTALKNEIAPPTVTQPESALSPTLCLF
jgi:hypothetical protein